MTSDVPDAIAQACAAAGKKQVTVVGGASIVQDCLNLGLVDELHLDMMPVLLGDGLRLFEHLHSLSVLERLTVTVEGQRTHLKFRVQKEEK